MALTACGTGGGSEAAGAQDTDTGEIRAVTHIYGETEIPADPQSVVAVSVTAAPVLLSLDVPVVAAGTTTPSALTDDNGFFAQWAPVAEERGVEPLPGPEISLEAVAAAGPDLIVGNGFGADAVDEATYEKLSEIAPTVVYGEGDVSWVDLTEQYARALDRTDRFEEITGEYDALVEESAARISTEQPVAVLSVTPNGFNVFTAESAQGRLATDLGLTLQELPEDAAADSTQGARTDIVGVAPENADALGDATLLFVNPQGDELDSYLETAPILESLPAWEDERAFTLGPSSFRMDYYSVPLLAERLTEVLPS
ncbi:Fe2+-enterobactin ABC transporter substrate-binding protein [Nocardiopsis sp. MT53]|uniref:Fe2+-enterobactin ABC transporter substrate-binding protein n=2 Tax=Nocardiopsidaceae TaxID=83676 RepID=A0ABX8BX68_9ACTN|nr:Fe2+-enterobactin ABC transporter substrate-binding protein [Nocardiopsis changdeensis]QYX40181.1 Fe2+-enterobactin ABC transporter substrate-binding protein [Nocardiopsis sp. MT53]